MVRVEGIPENQLKIASLGKARLEKGYPSVKKLLSYGIPKGLATTLAPFQRGGVDFVVEKGGRALIADGRFLVSFDFLLSAKLSSLIPHFVCCVLSTSFPMTDMGLGKVRAKQVMTKIFRLFSPNSAFLTSL